LRSRLVPSVKARDGTERGDYPRFYAEVASALRNGGPPPVSAAEGVAVVEVIEAALESARAGRVMSRAVER
jgi:predicted dehydrogenase